MTTLRRSIDETARRAIAERTEALFRRTGALREGHVALADGRHGDVRLDPNRVLQDPDATSELCSFWVGIHHRRDGTADVDAVAGAGTGGAILAFETARQLGTRAAFVDQSPEIQFGERVLLVDDRLDGGSLDRTIAAVEAFGGEIAECVVLVASSGSLSTRTSRATGRVYPLRALWTPELASYEPGNDCPGCAAGEPVITPEDTDTGPAPE